MARRVGIVLFGMLFLLPATNWAQRGRGAVSRPAGGSAVSGPGFAGAARGMPGRVVSAPAVRPAPGFAGAGVVRSPAAFGRRPTSTGFVQSPVGSFVQSPVGSFVQ